MNGLIEPNHLALLETLTRHDVCFVLVGGVALQLHGYSGATKDVDVTIAVDAANGRRVEAALSALGAQVDLAGARGSSYRTNFGRLEVMRDTAGPGDYEGWMQKAVQVEVSSSLKVWVGDPSDLLLSKELAARTKDLDALPNIRADLLAAGHLKPEDIRGPVAEAAQGQFLDPRLKDRLGPRPTSRRSRQLWDHAAELIADYRDRWGLADTNELLGPLPAAGTPQRADRASLDRQLNRLERLLGRDDAERAGPER